MIEYSSWLSNRGLNFRAGRNNGSMSTSDGGTRRPGFFYGWIIVAVAMVSMAFWLGIRSSFSVIYVALLEEFHWTRAGSAGVQSMALITYTLLAPLVGTLIDRWGPRRVVIPGILVLAFGLVLCSAIKTLNQFYLFYGVVMGSGITCIGIITYSAILAHWFEKSAVWPVASQSPAWDWELFCWSRCPRVSFPWRAGE